MIKVEIVLGLPGNQIRKMEWEGGQIRIEARHEGVRECPKCAGKRLRSKGCFRRRVRHEDWGMRKCILFLEGKKYQCQDCRQRFRQQFPGILKRQRASEAFQRMIFVQHLDGIHRSRLGKREGMGAATVERYFQKGLKRQFSERRPPQCPQVLGIDEHFFTRRKGFATTLCDLKNRKVYDVVLGRSELALEAYFQRLEGKAEVKVVCMDLATHYRTLVRKHSPQAKIVADRFQVIRLINHHLLACGRELDAVGSRNRGLLSLMRRHRHNLKPQQQVKRAAYFGKSSCFEAALPL